MEERKGPKPRKTSRLLARLQRAFAPALTGARDRQQAEQAKRLLREAREAVRKGLPTT